MSETRDGAPSVDSDLEASETAGDGSGPSMPLPRRGGKPVDVMESGRFAAFSLTNC